MATSDAPAARGAGRRAIRVGLVILAVGIVVALLANQIDRFGRMETIDAVHPYGALHLAGDALVLTESDGRVIAYDVTRHEATTLLDGLIRPVAADIGPDGTACAVSQDMAEAAWLTCTNGMRVDLAAFQPSGGSGNSPRALLADIVSNGASGWVVADGGRGWLLHVDGDGTVQLISRFPHSPMGSVVRGLDRSEDAVSVALGPAGIASLPLTARNQVTDAGSWVTAADSVAIVRGGDVPLVLLERSARSPGFVSSPGCPEFSCPHIVDGLDHATGLELLPDGRLAIAAGGDLLLVRPTNLPD